MKSTILPILAICSSMCSALTVEQKELETMNIPAIYPKAYGQKIHVAAHTHMYISGLASVCFSNITYQTKKAHYIFTISGIGKKVQKEGDIELPKKSSMCAQETMYLEWITGNAGLFGYDVVAEGVMSGERRMNADKGTVYVNQ